MTLYNLSFFSNKKIESGASIIVRIASMSLIYTARSPLMKVALETRVTANVILASRDYSVKMLESAAEVLIAINMMEAATRHEHQAAALKYTLEATVAMSVAHREHLAERTAALLNEANLKTSIDTLNGAD